MIAYIVQRVLWTIPVLLAVATITFVLMHAVPGGPWDSSLRPIDPTVKRNLEHEYGLDKPLWQQYDLYLLHLAQGDLGVSIHTNRTVREIVAGGFRVSATLGLLSLAISVTAGVTLGVASALRRNSAIDYLAVAFATAAASVPSFILGILLVLVFSEHLHWLPSGGWGDWKHAIMPALALSTLPAAYIARVTRASVLDVLEQGYVTTARAKGLRSSAIVLRHVLKNALIPVLTVTGPVAASLLTGSFIVEHLFHIHGIGFWFVDSTQRRDYGLIMGTTLLYAVVIVVANLVVDILYALVDPRIRYEAMG